MQIGHFVPRDPTYETIGDASFDGSGALSDNLKFWFMFIWNPEIRRRVRLSHTHTNYIHVNQLEFVTAILQLAAATTIWEDYPHLLPLNPPQIPVLLTWTDNMSTKKWTNKVSSTSKRAQPLVAILAALLQRTPFGQNAAHIPGKDNEETDLLSRPVLTAPLSVSPLVRLPQILDKLPRLKSYKFFLPDPMLVSALLSSLYSDAWQGDPTLPKKLGRVGPVSSITSNGFML
jgi:hypothetical protein